ncbi:molybdopterin-guanine dinucleotide biosynthesis protein MobA [Pigmentiphaga humi]|uniref:Molybdopterin-guanine dinucleotide biosynthesis protein MobA n=1 Tax=Pigmentiphaga humi TaxID=2478468 RepID=A0A3P4BAB5_9BURK|nr:nucleotidyltransferase family protein [Pigmentiphaga humi]VCU72570.1 molybdopterin-guanine dinucleotide biosynthesis protein MobA [Pigmentiphaga humi]
MTAGASSGTTLIGLLLAAGRGSRFSADGSANKLMAVLAGRPVCVAAAASLQAALPRVAAAVPASSSAAAGVLAQAGCEVVACDRASEGMGATLAQAVASLSRQYAGAGDPLPAWCVMPADMPWVHPDTIAALRDAWLALPPSRRGRAVLAPVYRGMRGNPVLLGPDWTDGLTQLRGDEGARRLIAGHVTPIEVSDPGCLRDVDTPQDLDAGPTQLA